MNCREGATRSCALESIKLFSRPNPWNAAGSTYAKGFLKIVIACATTNWNACLNRLVLIERKSHRNLHIIHCMLVKISSENLVYIYILLWKNVNGISWHFPGFQDRPKKTYEHIFMTFPGWARWHEEQFGTGVEGCFPKLSGVEVWAPGCFLLYIDAE